jgi:hypothetical protein
MRVSGIIAATAAVFLGFGSANAAIINVTTDNTVPATTAGALPTLVLGSDMIGMQATVTFADGSVDSGFWGSVSATGGGAFGAGGFFVVRTNNDTFSSTWTLDNLKPQTITHLSLNGVPSNTVFDIVAGSTETPNSGLGLSFVDLTNLPGTIEVTYSNPVGVGAAAPLNDIYAMMEIDFSGLTAGGVVPSTGYDFQQDTDEVNGLRLPPPDVPVPASLSLAAAAFAGLALWSRRK